MDFLFGSTAVSLIDAKDMVVAAARRDGDFEPELRGAWADACARGQGWAIDVGAYTGLYAIAAARLGRQAVAVEPMPKNVARMHDNIRVNRARVTVIEAAAGAAPGMATMHFNRTVQLTSGASLIAGQAHNEFNKVTVRPVDSFGLTDVCALKIDVEGAEIDVLRGAERTIAMSMCPIFLEALDDAAMSTCSDFLRRLGYAPKNLDVRNIQFTAVGAGPHDDKHRVSSQRRR